MSGTILLVRHGQASTGAADYDRLSPLGLEQSRLLGSWLTRCGLMPDRIVTGRMLRHRQTASGCAEAGGWMAVPSIVGGFDEFDRAAIFGSASGVSQREAVERWVGGRHDSDYPESWPAFSDRCLAAFGALDERGVTLVATSAGPIAAICRHLLGVPRERTVDLAATLMNGAVTMIERGPEGPVLRSFNNIAHLRETRRSELITRS